MYAFSIITLVASGVLYQLFQKLISPSVNPALSLVLSYLSSLLLSSLLLLVFPLKEPLAASLKHVNPFSFLLALPIVGIELGYLLLYRNGGKLSYSSALVAASVTAILLAIGFIFFRERLDLPKAIGMALCVAGVFLLNVR